MIIAVALKPMPVVLHRALFVVCLAFRSFRYYFVCFFRLNNSCSHFAFSKYTPLSAMQCSRVVVIPQSNFDFSRPLFDFLLFFTWCYFSLEFSGLDCLGFSHCVISCFLPFAVSPSIRPQPCKLEVWEWVVKCRIFDPLSEFSGLFLLMHEFSMNLHIRSFRVG